MMMSKWQDPEQPGDDGPVLPRCRTSRVDDSRWAIHAINVSTSNIKVKIRFHVYV